LADAFRFGRLDAVFLGAPEVLRFAVGRAGSGRRRLLGFGWAGRGSPAAQFQNELRRGLSGPI